MLSKFLRKCMLGGSPKNRLDSSPVLVREVPIGISAVKCKMTLTGLGLESSLTPRTEQNNNINSCLSQLRPKTIDDYLFRDKMQIFNSASV